MGLSEKYARSNRFTSIRDSEFTDEELSLVPAVYLSIFIYRLTFSFSVRG